MDYTKIIETYRDEFYERLKELIAIESIKDEKTVAPGAPFGKGCKDALDYMLDLAKKDGFKTINYDGYCGVIEYGEGQESIGVLAHLDLVTVGDEWVHDPFGAEMEKGFVFGRGVMDDKGPALEAYFALKALKANGFIPKRKIMLILGCDEESGMECMHYYLKHGEIPTLGFTPDAEFPLIYGESGMLGFEICGKISDCPVISLDSGERSNIVLAKATALMRGADETQRCEFAYYLNAHHLEGSFEGNTLEFVGKAAHSAEVFKGVNAGLHLLNYVGISFDNHECRELYAMLADWRGSGLGIDMNGAYMGFLTMNIGKIKIEDDQIRITVDIRYPNDISAEELTDIIKAKLNAKLDDFRLENLDMSHRPLFVDPNSEFVKALLNAYREMSGDIDTPPLAIRGGTYAKCFDNFVAFGPEFQEQHETDIVVGAIHQPNEAAYFDDMLKAMAIYMKAMNDLQDVKI